MKKKPTQHPRRRRLEAVVALLAANGGPTSHRALATAAEIHQSNLSSWANGKDGSLGEPSLRRLYHVIAKHLGPDAQAREFPEVICGVPTDAIRRETLYIICIFPGWLENGNPAPWWWELLFPPSIDDEPDDSDDDSAPIRISGTSYEVIIDSLRSHLQNTKPMRTRRQQELAYIELGQALPDPEHDMRHDKNLDNRPTHLG